MPIAVQRARMLVDDGTVTLVLNLFSYSVPGR